MKVLFISAGLPDKRSGGLPAYVADAAEALLARGYDLHYLDTSGRNIARNDLYYETTRRNDGMVVTRFFNLGMLADYGRGTLDPLAQTRPEPRFLELFMQWLAGIEVDLVHIHEFIGFPVDALACFFKRQVRVMATMHDFYALCPTVNLMFSNGKPCHLKTSELVCRQCCVEGVSMAEFILSEWMQRISCYRGGSWMAGVIWPRLRPFVRIVRRWSTRTNAYQIRRKVFLSILKQLDVICGNSNLTTAVYRQIGGLENVETDGSFTLNTIRHFPLARPGRCPGEPLRILVLNVRRAHKGLDLFKYELARLSPIATGNLRFLAWGCSQIESPLVENFGSYAGHQLDAICQNADFGLVPSLWRETYGFVGAEMLSRGLPLVASQIGAMREYITEGQDGLLFDPLRPGELANVLNQLATDKTLQERLIHGASKSWQKFNSFEQHIDQLVRQYEQLLNNPPRQSSRIS